MVPDEITSFCAGKSAVLVVEEGQPDYIEQAVGVTLRRADINTLLEGKGAFPMAGEYTSEVMLRGLLDFLAEHAPAGIDMAARIEQIETTLAEKDAAAAALGADLPVRVPTFCTGCPERPVFSAFKIMEREIGATHISADIGCHTFATLPPFNAGNTVLGYGLGLASSAAVAPAFGRRVISIMGDGGFWHNGMVTGVAAAQANENDSVLVILKNGYTAATGWQLLPSSARDHQGRPRDMSIEKVLKGLGVKWVRTLRSYGIGPMVHTLREALTTAEKGLKVIIADGECQLARQRRVRPQNAADIEAGKRVVRTRFGVDDELCTGDHSCIRLSGCPSLTIAPNPDPLRDDPVAHVNNDCVGCGVCGEVAHAAVLCPSFYEAHIVHNPTLADRLLYAVRRRVIGMIQGTAGSSAGTAAEAAADNP
jgi:indolepyruvate ferredoxin oxidoreductase alpha subunit